MKRVYLITILLFGCCDWCAAQSATAGDEQTVAGFGEIVFSHQGPRDALDFLGVSPGYMTAAWWSPIQMQNNVVTWKTAVVPAKKKTLFRFVGASMSPPPEYTSKHPMARLYVNDTYALTFELGIRRDAINAPHMGHGSLNYMWGAGGEYQLRYHSKRVEWPYGRINRQFFLHGNSGIYELTVPASSVETGKPCTVKVEVLPFPDWPQVWFMVKDRSDDVLKQPEEKVLSGQIDVLQKEVQNLHRNLHVLATQVYGDMVDAQDFQNIVIYSNGARHVHPPDLIPLENGELLLTFREASEHLGQDADVIMLRSGDGGLTWGERQVVAGRPKRDDRGAVGLQLSDGTVLLITFVNDCYNPDGTFAYPGYNSHSVYSLLSTDNGRTWSEPRQMTDPPQLIADEGHLADAASAPIEMPDGSVIVAINTYGRDFMGASVLMRTVDKGGHWEMRSVIAKDPGEKLGGFWEPGLVRTQGGRLVAALRNEMPPHWIWMTHSDDDGRTWSKPTASTLSGYPAELLQLSDGRLLCTYGLRPGVHGEPGGIRIAFSNDEGQTWERVTQIRKDFFDADIGYPVSVERPGGKVLTVYYYNLFDRYFIGGTLWDAKKL